MSIFNENNFLNWPRWTLKGGEYYQLSNLHWEEVTVKPSESLIKKILAVLLYPFFTAIAFIIDFFNPSPLPKHFHEQRKKDDTQITTFIHQNIKPIFEKLKLEPTEDLFRQFDATEINIRENLKKLVCDQDIYEPSTTEKSRLGAVRSIRWSDEQIKEKFAELFHQSALNFIVLICAMIKGVESAKHYASWSHDEQLQARLSCLVARKGTDYDRLKFAYLFIYATFFDCYHAIRSQCDIFFFYNPSGQIGYTPSKPPQDTPLRTEDTPLRTEYNATMRFFYDVYGQDKTFRQRLDEKDQRFTAWTREDYGHDFKIFPDTKPSK